MRRRTLLGGGSIEYVFSAQSTSVSVNYYLGSTNVNITSTANGTNIGYSAVGWGGVVTYVATAATRITIQYSANSTYNERSGIVVLQQNGSNKTITINVSQSANPLDLGYHGILVDGASGSNGSIHIGYTTAASFSNVPSWADVTNSSGYINVTASSTNSASTARLATITVSIGSQSDTLTIIQLPSDYHSRDYVSIGGANWAIKNVGASSVQDYGNYYQWGAGSITYENEDQYYTGNDTLPSSADTATQVMGSGWRMPTYDELYALRNSSYYWVSYNGVNGNVCYSDGNVLFIPAAGKYTNGKLVFEGTYGYVWSSTHNKSNTAHALNSYYGNMYAPIEKRNNGFSVRGVQV